MADQDALAQAQEHEQKRQSAAQMEERKQIMLTSLLTPEAKERLARIAMVKADKADEVTDMILSMAQRGAITEKISETRLKQMMETVNESHKGPKITFARKKRADSDEDEEYDL